MKKLITALMLALLNVTAFSAMAAKPKVKTETVTYEVNMHCQNCVNKLTDNLSFLKGVEDFKISLKEKTITIKFDPSKIEEKKFVETIEKLGYTATKQPVSTKGKGKRN
ncbi:MAG: heavy-metal-associated domain-containing protein [Bacteroidales bacterium]|nr:heavy-metal-associated domain-containing protein [Bacteroidales bacterium]